MYASGTTRIEIIGLSLMMTSFVLAGFVFAQEGLFGNVQGALDELGCESVEDCQDFCSDPTNLDKCTEVGQKYGLLKTSSAAADAVKDLAKEGLADDIVACQTGEKTAEECFELARLLTKKNPKAARELGIRGEEVESQRATHSRFEQFRLDLASGAQECGGAKTPEECGVKCEIYFSDSAGAPDYCPGIDIKYFGGGHSGQGREGGHPGRRGGPPPALIQKVMREGGPGGCTNEEECMEYCDQEEHMPVCIEFAHDNDFMDDQEYAMAKKMIGKTGPGGCRGRTCEAFCANPDNVEECANWAMENDVLPPEHTEKIKEMMKFEIPGVCRGAQCMKVCSQDPAPCMKYCMGNPGACPMMGSPPPGMMGPGGPSMMRPGMIPPGMDREDMEDMMDREGGEPPSPECLAALQKKDFESMEEECDFPEEMESMRGMMPPGMRGGGFPPGMMGPPGGMMPPDMMGPGGPNLLFPGTMGGGESSSGPSPLECLQALQAAQKIGSPEAYLQIPPACIPPGMMPPSTFTPPPTAALLDQLYYLAEVASTAAEKEKPIPPHLQKLAKELKCKSLIECRTAATKVIDADIRLWADLLKKHVDVNKLPKQFQQFITLFAKKPTVAPAKPAAKLVPKPAPPPPPKPAAARPAPAAQAPAKNPCPTVDNVQWASIPDAPKTKVCFGKKNNFDLVIGPGAAAQIPPYYFKQSLNCREDQVTAIKADGTGIECAAPGAPHQFTYNLCPKGFRILPEPEEGKPPKICFGKDLNGIYVMWNFLSASSTAVLPETYLGSNKQCDYAGGFERGLEFSTKTASGIDILCDYRGKTKYPLPNWLSIPSYPFTITVATTTYSFENQSELSQACYRGKIVTTAAVNSLCNYIKAR